MGKIQISVQLPDTILNKLEALQAIDSKNKPSRNQIIEDSINFYFGYKTSETSQEYLCSVLGQKIEGMINSSTDRTARLQFKEAVELNMLTRLIASNFNIDKQTYDKMRKTAVDDVKATKGIISIYEAQN